MPGITPNQSLVLAHIESHYAQFGKPPTLKEIAAARGWKAVSTAWEVIQSLKAKDLIRQGHYQKIQNPSTAPNQDRSEKVR